METHRKLPPTSQNSKMYLLQDSPQWICVDEGQNLEHEQKEESVMREYSSEHVPEIAHIWSVIVDSETKSKYIHS
jgi:hypothetical protein